MKIFYDEQGKQGNYFELQDVEDFPKMKKIKGIFAKGSLIEQTVNFNYSLENVIDGSYSFYWNWDLVGFNSNLSKLENGDHMFFNCTNLTTFTSDLSSLTNGYEMFDNCKNLTTFSSDSSGSPVNLSSLTDGDSMFRYCSNLTTFSSGLPSLTNGHWMFRSCSNLTSFTSDLGSLKSGFEMFYECKLNEESLYNIADTINDILDLDKTNNEHWKYEVLEETKTISSSRRGRIDIGHDETVAQNVIIECGNKLIVKGWKVYFNGTLYEYTNVASPYDVSEANGYIPDAYKNGSDSWNTVVLTPKMDELKISIVNEKGEMLNDE